MMSKMPDNIVSYAENLFAYLNSLGWESPDKQRINELEAEVEVLKHNAQAEMDGIHHLREKYGARDNETFPMFVDRLFAANALLNELTVLKLDAYKRLLGEYNEQIVQQEISALTESQSAECKPAQTHK